MLQENDTMALNEKEMFERIEIGLAAYYDEMGTSGQIQVEVFVDWLYNKYGRVRKGVEHEKLVAVQSVGISDIQS